MTAAYNSTEPTVTVWINARDVQSAVERLTALLALTWEVAPDRVCLNGGRSEIEIERESVQLASAGARRWLESGSAGDDPLYHRAPTLYFLGATDLERLRAAFAGAQAHARELHHKWQGLSAEARSAGKGRGADHCSWRAEDYRRVGWD